MCILIFTGAFIVRGTAAALDEAEHALNRIMDLKLCYKRHSDGKLTVIDGDPKDILKQGDGNAEKCKCESDSDADQ